jgi:selenocysteine-specific elongation factor
MIIGTAGHIDHGKTALIQRLTGIDTDRLPEEKRRGMTIDLGFAHLDLEGVGRVGIVDVPGHDRFVHNMVAGASGFDLVLLVVAADDGVMPQTREHLDIVSVLGLESCVVALNKIDLVSASRVQAAMEEIRALAQVAPCLRAAPVVPVSAHTGEGLDELRRALAEKLNKLPPRDAGGYLRMAIDRAFTRPGFGPVVTGTIVSGRVHRDDTLRLLPGGETVRVRGLQTHSQATESAEAGNRCALNLAGVEKESLQRGMMVCDPRLERVAHIVDVALALASGLDRSLRDHQRVRFHSGTAEEFARLVWIEPSSADAADAAGVAQLRLENAVPLLYRDRFVLRDEPARQTLGGGVVLDPFASRHGLNRPERRETLHRLRTLDTEQALDAWLAARGAQGWLLPELAQQLAEPPERLMPRLARREDLIREVTGTDTWIASSGAVDDLLGRLQQTLADYLRTHPRSTAMPLATLHASACPRLDTRLFRLLVARLTEAGKAEQIEDGLCPPGHRQQFPALEARLAERIEAELHFHHGRPLPKLATLARAVGQTVSQLSRFLGELERAGRVVKLAPEVYATQSDLDAWREHAESFLAQHGQMTLAQFRDEIGAGREFAMQVLDYLDRAGVTRRRGDARVAAKAVPPLQAAGGNGSYP